MAESYLNIHDVRYGSAGGRTVSELIPVEYSSIRNKQALRIKPTPFFFVPGKSPLRYERANVKPIIGDDQVLHRKGKRILIVHRRISEKNGCF